MVKHRSPVKLPKLRGPFFQLIATEGSAVTVDSDAPLPQLLLDWFERGIVVMRLNNMELEDIQTNLRTQTLRWYQDDLLHQRKDGSWGMDGRLQEYISDKLGKGPVH